MVRGGVPITICGDVEDIAEDGESRVFEETSRARVLVLVDCGKKNKLLMDAFGQNRCTVDMGEFACFFKTGSLSYKPHHDILR